jgi:hypothetical protein
LRNLNFKTLSYKNNKATIIAKRSEIAFERQLEALRSYVQTMGKVKEYVFRNMHYKKTEDIEKFFRELNEKYVDTYHSYQNLRIYLPSHIDSAIVDYGDMLRKYIYKGDYQNLEVFAQELSHVEKEIVALMQESLGLNNHRSAN